MNYLPICIDVKKRKCLVVGGGTVAERKVALLKKAGADITVISPTLTIGLSAQLEAGNIQHVQEKFEPHLLNLHALVIAATNDRDINKQVAGAAKQKNIPVNVVDTPDLCTFIVPSIVDRSPLLIAVSSSGAAPVLARIIRARIETLIPASYGRLAAMTSKYRQKVKDKFKEINHRRNFWEAIFQGRVAELVYSGNDKEAEELLTKQLQASDNTAHDGEVYLVGAGPGDPDLLTFRALRLMQQADVVVYDRLVSKEVLDLVRRDAELIYAGKEKDNHAIPQEDINHLLVRLAKEGHRVCRLKGGDPFIFGRGGEEIETLADENIPFQVVPGITAASGCSSYAGIPLTHRDYSQSASFVTGHLRDGKVNLNWDGLVLPRQTIVIYMGLVGIDALCSELMAHGLTPEMPVALIQQGTTRHQRVYEGTLKTMPTIVKEEDIKAPTLIIVGEVVKLRKKLNWFKSNG